MTDKNTMIKTLTRIARDLRDDWCPKQAKVVEDVIILLQEMIDKEENK